MIAYQRSLQKNFKEPETDEPTYDSVKSVFAGAVQDKYNENAKGFTKKAGIKELKGSAETLAKLEAFGKPIVDAWLKKTAAMGVDGKAAIAFYQQTYAEELAMIKK